MICYLSLKLKKKKQNMPAMQVRKKKLTFPLKLPLSYDCRYCLNHNYTGYFHSKEAIKLPSFLHVPSVQKLN